MSSNTKKILLASILIVAIVAACLIYSSMQKNRSIATPVDQTETAVTGSLEVHDDALVYFGVLPRGDDMSGDIWRYLTGVVVHDVSFVELDEMQRIRESLERLFAIDEYTIPDTDLDNMLAPSNLSVRAVSRDPAGVYHIDLGGTIVGIGTLADPFIKLQIVKTIEAYVEDYVVTLNGEESLWRCALDMSGLCE